MELPKELPQGHLINTQNIEHINPNTHTLETNQPQTHTTNTNQPQTPNLVHIQPLHADSLLIQAPPNTPLNLGITHNGNTYHFTLALQKNKKTNTWEPLPNSPPQYHYHIYDQNNQPPPLNTITNIYKTLQTLAELYHRAYPQEFLTAELTWYKNTLKDWTTTTQRINQGNATEQERQDYYKIKFTGAITAIRKAATTIEQLLNQTNPE